MSCVHAAKASVDATDEPSNDLRAYWLTNFLTPYGDVHLERIRAHESHSGGGLTLEQLPADADAWLEALSDSVHSLARVLCDRQPPLDLRCELVKVAAVACAWIDSIDRTGEPG